MRDADFPAFVELLDAVCGLLSRGTYTPSAVNSALWFRALQMHPLEAVRAGFDAHVRDPQRGRFVPTPADVLAQIVGIAAADDGRPGAEEAWAIALRATDEADTVVWTTEMAQAWQIARAVLDLGDEVGARMAFREAYSRLVDQARAVRSPATWAASLGFDAGRRELAIRSAVDLGRLPRAELLALPPPALTGGLPDDIRRTMAALADNLRNRADPVSADEIELERTRQLQAETAAKVRAYTEARG